jgi:hypothetical protein
MIVGAGLASRQADEVGRSDQIAGGTVEAVADAHALDATMKQPIASDFGRTYSAASSIFLWRQDLEFP